MKFTVREKRTVTYNPALAAKQRREIGRVEGLALLLQRMPRKPILRGQEAILQQVARRYVYASYLSVKAHQLPRYVRFSHKD